MGIFEKHKKRNIIIASVCGIIMISSGICAGIFLWPKDDQIVKNPVVNMDGTDALSKLNDVLNPNTNADNTSNSQLYTVVPCEETTKVTGESCQNEPTYPSYNQNYTTPETTPEYTPSPYNTPNVDPTPTYTPTCADYHTQYYAEYTNRLHEVNSRYTSAINNAAVNCKSFSGCPQKTSLEQRWKSEVAILKSRYQTSMSNSGCNPDEYVSM